MPPDFEPNRLVRLHVDKKLGRLSQDHFQPLSTAFRSRVGDSRVRHDQNDRAPAEGAATAGALSPRPSTLRKVRQIFEAARAVFMEFGYDASSMEVIAKQAGVSKATVYAHFTSKEDLFEALIRHECEIIRASIYMPDARNEDLAGELRKMARNITELFTREDGLALYRILVPVARRFPRLGEIFYCEGPQIGRAAFAAFLRDAQQRGRLTMPDIDLAAEQFMSLIRGDLDLEGSLLRTPRAEPQIEALIEGGISLFLTAYGPAAQPAATPAPAARARRQRA